MTMHHTVTLMYQRISMTLVRDLEEKNGKPGFARSSIYRLWAMENSKRWKCDEDEVKSARILLEEAAKLKDILGKALIKTMVLQPSLSHYQRLYENGAVRYVRSHSTLPTNRSSFKIFALLGKVYSSGLPLGYLLIQSNQGEAEGKERYISNVLAYFKKTWKIRAIITLTDKDWSEINAFLKNFPDAKHHILRRQPAFYNVEQAHEKYPNWIDLTFVPVKQALVPPEIMPATQTILPHLKVRVGGVVIQPPKRPRLVIRMNGALRNVLSGPNRSADDSEMSPVDESMFDEDEDLLDEVDKAIGKGDESDDEDGPDWMFDEGETVSKDKEYVFCPAVHRHQLLHLFTKHFCQHTLFVE
ncbi:hypothetical protein C8J56DRAFT_889708 [Mycena floridula]|nr:hypothetical protein C8J56DRAFT_889708 [Mycena floridula]